MDNSVQPIQSTNDDQELAKVLAGITQQPSNLGFEEVSAPAPSLSMPPQINPIPTPPMVAPTPNPAPITGYNPPAPDPVMGAAINATTGDLESIKKDALLELRPLVDKLDLAADEKFDIYLLLLRSTDDKTLIAPAHKAAASIPDESKKAQALLDIIKEIDYLSASK